MVVGGGPAGLSAAYWLARYRRRVRLYDAGEPRNRTALAVHGYPGVVDPAPDELRRRIRGQAAAAGAELVGGRVGSISGEKDDFRVEVEGGSPVHARRILLAYGCRDEIPDIPGLGAAYGVTVHHCPDCDGPSASGEPAGVVGWTRGAAALALFLLTWAERVSLLTHGREPELDEAALATLRRHGIALRTTAIARIDHRRGRIRSVQLAGGERLPLRRLFVHLRTSPAADLARRLGCRARDGERLIVDDGQQTTVPGVYAAGDIAGHPHLAVSAAADGVRAALALHRSLLPPDHEL